MLTSLTNTKKEYLNLIKLLISISLFAHIMACIWNFVGTQSGRSFNTSWLIV